MNRPFLPLMPSYRLGLQAQPIVDFECYPGPGNLYDECLARILVAGSTIIGPVTFIDKLEASGFIGLFDAAVLELVLDGLEANPDARLASNISPLTLADGRSWDRIADLIAKRSDLAGRLILEVTESFPLSAVRDARHRLTEIRWLGCRIAIDDFGAGSAIPLHLHGLDIPWDFVKIDSSWQAGPRGSMRTKLHSLITMAKDLAPTIIVEGIETSDHFAAAYAAGVQFGQGYHFRSRFYESWGEALSSQTKPVAEGLTFTPH